MIRHDFECPVCSRTERDALCTGDFHIHPCTCGSPMQIVWGGIPRPYIGLHSKERAVVWYNPRTGRHATPGRNDVPMPSRYARDGYERREFTTLRELDSFCKQNRLVNEASHYDKGSGRAYDDTER